MEQLILIGIIIVFSSMLDAVARKKRGAESAEMPLPLPPTDESEPGPPRPFERSLPTYDQDPSFDDAAEAGSRGTPARGTVSGGGGGTAGSASSEGMIPTDVWEEIQALARGEEAPARPPTVPKRAPRPPGPSAPPPEAPPERAQRSAPLPRSRAARQPPAPEVPSGGAVVAPEHSVHLTHPKYGTPVQDRLTDFDEGTRTRGLSADGQAVRAVLRGRGASLRQAVLLQEILGPPVSLKDDPSAG